MVPGSTSLNNPARGELFIDKKDMPAFGPKHVVNFRRHLVTGITAPARDRR